MPEINLTVDDIIAELRGKIHKGYAIENIRASFLHEGDPQSSLLVLLQSELILSGLVQQKIRQHIYQNGRSLGLNIYCLVYDALDAKQSSEHLLSDDNVHWFKNRLIAIEQTEPDNPAPPPSAQIIQVLFKQIEESPNYADGFATLQSFLADLGDAFREALFNARSLMLQIEHFKKSTQGESPWRFGADVAMSQAYKALMHFDHRRFLIFRALQLAFAVFIFALLGYGVFSKISEQNQTITLSKAPPAEAIGGIIGRYFKGKNFQTFVAERVDASIDLSLTAKQKPMDKMPKDKFSIRWQGFLYSEKSGDQVICSKNDDGARIWLGEKLIIDDWTSHWPRKNCTTIKLKKGWYALKVEYFEKTKSSQMHLQIGDSLLKTKAIPAKHYCCTKQKKAE